MPSCTVHLPPLRFKDCREGYEVTLDATLRLSDSTHLDLGSFERLAQAVSAESLWIIRSRACYLNVHLRTVGLDMPPGEVAVDCLEGIPDLELFDRLGVRVLPSQALKPGGFPGACATFSLQHADLCSSLTPPSHALVEDFESLTCQITVAGPAPYADSSRSRGRRPQKRKRAPSDDAILSVYHLGFEDEMFLDLEQDDQRAIDEFMSAITATDEVSLHDDATFSSSNVHLARCLEKALSILLIGDQTPKARYQIQSRPPCPLIQLAPAVFHMQHLKAVAATALCLPTIAQCLSRMSTAESPSLRRKVQDLNKARPEQEEPLAELSLADAIEKQLWELTITNIKTPPVKLKQKTHQSKAGENMDPTSSLEADEMTILDVNIGHKAYPTPSSSQGSAFQRNALANWKTEQSR